MSSKTPQFDKALRKILGEIRPHKRICASCNFEFEISEDDIVSYKFFRVPPPQLCPLCRLRQKAASGLRLPPFYRKPCAVPGHTERPVTIFPSTSPHLIYDNNFWRSDHWDELAFGLDYDPQNPFFDAFKRLFFAVPHQALFVDPSNINSEYSIGGAGSRGCYYVSVPLNSENIMYAFLPMKSRDCVDVTNIENSELLYECINAWESYNCNFSMDITKCRDSWFLYDCKNCDHCFMSSNLRNKSYYFYNKPLDRATYEEKLRSLGLASRDTLNKLVEEFEGLKKSATHRAIDTRNAIDSVGDRISDCKKCFYVFEAHENCENLRYVQSAVTVKDAADVYGIANSENIFGSYGLSMSSGVRFSNNIRFSNDIEYSAYIRYSKYCFGSVGLRNKSFCIFNKQFTEEEYWRRVDAIKTAMLARSEYGEFFPLGWMPYQNTMANIEFPMNKNEAVKLGIPWWEETEEHLPDIQKISESEIPQTVGEIEDSILQKGIVCRISGKLFRIVQPELDLYRKKNIPVPVVHPDVRMRRRFASINRFRLWPHNCEKCGGDILTSYDPSRKLKIWCEPCFLSEFE